MVPAIVIGREDSKGFPGKNLHPINDFPLFCYPLAAAISSMKVDKVYLSTDSDDMKRFSKHHFPVSTHKTILNLIDRPKELATDEALAEDVFVHAYNYIKQQNPNDKIDFVVLLFANAPCVCGKMIDNMIFKIQNPVEYLAMVVDSIATVSKYNMFSPYRMRLMANIEEHLVINFLDDNNSSCDRNDKGDFYIYDCSCAVVKSRVFDNIKEYPCPQRWLGGHIMPYKQQIPALDVDYQWQLGQVEYWWKHYDSKIS